MSLTLESVRSYCVENQEQLILIGGSTAVALGALFALLANQEILPAGVNVLSEAGVLATGLASGAEGFALGGMVFGGAWLIREHLRRARELAPYKVAVLTHYPLISKESFISAEDLTPLEGILPKGKLAAFISGDAAHVYQAGTEDGTISRLGVYNFAHVEDEKGRIHAAKKRLLEESKTGAFEGKEFVELSVKELQKKKDRQSTYQVRGFPGEEDERSEGKSAWKGMVIRHIPEICIGLGTAATLTGIALLVPQLLNISSITTLEKSLELAGTSVTVFGGIAGIASGEILRKERNRRDACKAIQEQFPVFEQWEELVPAQKDLLKALNEKECVAVLRRTSQSAGSLNLYVGPAAELEVLDIPNIKVLERPGQNASTLLRDHLATRQDKIRIVDVDKLFPTFWDTKGVTKKKEEDPLQTQT